MPANFEQSSGGRRLDRGGDAIEVVDTVSGNLRAAGSKVDDVQVQGGYEILGRESGFQSPESGGRLCGGDANLIRDIKGGVLGRWARAPDPVGQENQCDRGDNCPQPGCARLHLPFNSSGSLASACRHCRSGTAGIGKDVTGKLAGDEAAWSESLNQVGQHEGEGGKGGSEGQARLGSKGLDGVTPNSRFKCRAGEGTGSGSANPGRNKFAEAGLSKAIEEASQTTWSFHDHG